MSEEAAAVQPLEPGTRVRFAVESLGAIERDHVHQLRPGWVDRVFGHGESGVVVEIEGASLPPGWFYVQPDDVETVLVPVADVMVEKIEDAS